MPVTDLIIWYLAIYGMAWTVVYSNITRKIRDFTFVNREKTFFGFFYKLIHCIVCTSFWFAALFVNEYFNSETIITKILIVYSNVAFTWFFASIFDKEE